VACAVVVGGGDTTRQDEACVMHHQFDHDRSSSYKKLDMTMDVQFGTGRIEGQLAQDHFTLGPVKVKNQVFGEITSEVSQSLRCISHVRSSLGW
jgi:hypothetical protein